MTGTLPLSSDAPVRTREDLVRYFTAGIKEPPRWGVGLEYERLGLDRKTGRAAPYSGPRGVEAVLRSLADRFGWKADFEGERIIGLERGDSHVTLEPGGQLELSGRVHPDVGRLRRELTSFLREAAAVSGPLDIAWVPLGLQPLTPVEAIEWVPKGRYGIMGPFLGARGKLAHHMMKGTAGVQINFDYGSEADAMEKLRVALAVSAIATAASANSPLYEGRESGYLSRRAHIWTDTDPARCGLPEFAFRESLAFADYVEYALGVPTLFIRRNDRWVDMEGMPFRGFLTGGWRGLTATEADWAMHLTTIFTEVRLKTYVEVRGLDSVTPDLVLAFVAFWKGLLYDERARRAAWALVASCTFDERTTFFSDVARLGPAARLGERSARDLARELVAIARDGLMRICGGTNLPPCAAGEAGLLGPLEESLDGPGGCPAARLLDAWRGGGGADPGALARLSLRRDEEFLRESDG